MITHHYSSIKLGSIVRTTLKAAQSIHHFYVAEVTNSVRKMSRIYLGTAQRVKPRQVEEKYPETETRREFAFPTSITETTKAQDLSHACSPATFGLNHQDVLDEMKVIAVG